MIPDRLIAAALFNPTSLRSPNSWIGHLPFAAWVMQQVSPKIFVELGTHSGNSYFAFCQSVAEARLSLSGISQAPSQASNEWAVMTQAPEEAWAQLVAELSDRDGQIARLNYTIN